MSITVGQVTRYLRDFPEYNILLDAIQFTEEDVADAMKFATDEYNAMTPMTAYEISAFPNDWVLLMGTAAHLMQSESFLQLRNQVSYQDGDIQASIDDKSAGYAQMSAKLKEEWRSTAQRMKQQINLESCYGSLPSGYRYIKPGYRNW